MRTRSSLTAIFFFSVYLLSSLVTCDPDSPEVISDNSKESPKDEGSLSAAEVLAKKGSLVSDDDFIHGFLAALSVIIVSELGDKTFFIAAIM